MDWGYINFVGFTILFAIYLLISLITGRTLGGILMGEVYSRKNNPTMYWSFFGLMSAGFLLMLLLAVLATADKLGYPLI
jgi:hypothetical protein